MHIGGEPRLLRYNSRLAIVVYVPEGVEVRRRAVALYGGTLSGAACVAARVAVVMRHAPQMAVRL